MGREPMISACARNEVCSGSPRVLRTAGSIARISSSVVVSTTLSLKCQALSAVVIFTLPPAGIIGMVQMPLLSISRASAFASLLMSGVILTFTLRAAAPGCPGTALFRTMISKSPLCV